MNISSDDLYEFGKWARDHKENLCAKSSWTMLMRDNVADHERYDISYDMTDDKADKIDKAVCRLCNYNAHLGQVFIQHYVLGMSYRALAKEYACPRSAISSSIDLAGGYVIGVATSA